MENLISPRILLLSIGMLTIIACSNKAVYHAIQENRLNECKKLEGYSRDECIKNYNETYDQYIDDRKELN